MERTVIAWNVPNMITIPLMAAIGFLAVAVIWQLVQRTTGKPASAAQSGQGGY